MSSTFGLTVDHAHHIVDPVTAFGAISLALHRPPRPETVAVLCGSGRRGAGVIVVNGTSQPDDAIEVVECLTSTALVADGLRGIVIASVRPSGGLDHGDADRWLEMSDIAGSAGVELLEWWVIGDQVDCPRDQLGEPPRW